MVGVGLVAGATQIFNAYQQAPLTVIGRSEGRHADADAHQGALTEPKLQDQFEKVTGHSRIASCSGPRQVSRRGEVARHRPAGTPRRTNKAVTSGGEAEDQAKLRLAFWFRPGGAKVKVKIAFALGTPATKPSRCRRTC
jgi:hypothetical protein